MNIRGSREIRGMLTVATPRQPNYMLQLDKKDFSTKSLKGPGFAELAEFQLSQLRDS